VFLFSKKTHSLLIQQRAATKIVFPEQWANTCCSHPLFNDADMENVLGNQIGIKRAAVKRLDIELGLKGVKPSQLSFKEKILYGQLSPGGIFGESECDYILMGELINDSMFPANDNEVEKVEWIPPGPEGSRTSHLIEFLDKETQLGYPPTPWFDLILRERDCLETWWESLIRDTKTFMDNEDVKNGEIRNFLHH
jgi:isopentenyl-diphosphate delta-isomerase